MDVTSVYATEEPGAGLAEVDICTLEIIIKHEVIPSIVCSVCLSFGLIYCFFGYRCFKMVMFFSGFMFGSGAVLLLHHKEPMLEAHLGTETKAGIGLGVGVLFGLITMLVSTIGLLLCGLQLGSLVPISMSLLVAHFHSPTPLWVPFCATLAASITTAVFTLQWQKVFTIIYTSVFGALAVTLCVDYTVVVSPGQVFSMPRPLCWFNWVIGGIWPVLSLLGVLVQWKFTAKGVTHIETTDKKSQKKNKKRKHRESSGRPQTHRRRRPPPLKRYASDVLAPSYLQSLKERQMETTSSLCSTNTHTLIHFDYERGSMVPLTAACSIYKV